jgi:hypothetical protein
MSFNKRENENLIEEINNNIDIIDINRSFTENNNKINKPENERQRFESYSSFKSNSSAGSNRTLDSMPFKEELDLDLPNFSPTKYNSDIWKIINCILYSIFSLGLLVYTVFFLLKKDSIYTKLACDISFFFYNLMNWLHYKRGCIGYSNLNSRLKTNVDKSFKAKFLRSEYGMKYFYPIIACFILIYSDIYYLVFSKKANEDYWNINLVGFMIISLAQILKIEKILTNNKQYSVMNDLPNCIIEISLFFSSLIFSTSFIIQMAYDYLKDSFQLLNFIRNVIGILFLFISVISLLLRYFMSGYDDLNTSEISNLTERDV